MRILLHRADRAGRRVVIEQPVEVRPEEVDERAVRIGLFVGKDVMHPVDGHPLGRRVLQRALGEQRETVLEPLGQHEAAVSQQSVVAERDAHAVERHTENRQGHAGPAKEPGNEGGHREQVNRHDRDDVHPDHAVESDGLRTRQSQVGRAGGRRRGFACRFFDHVWRWANWAHWRMGLVDRRCAISGGIWLRQGRSPAMEGHGGPVGRRQLPKHYRLSAARTPPNCLSRLLNPDQGEVNCFLLEFPDKS